MSNVNVNIKLDKNLKENFARVCDEMGMNMTTAFNIFAKAVVNEEAIPFKVRANTSLLGPYNSFDDILNEIDEEINAENLSNQ